MMTSTFPGSRSNPSLRNEFKSIQSKKDALIKLEAALKKRTNEFKELCLKEGELTGHLPVDYPLQPREPIPQVRRRVQGSSNNNNNYHLGNNNQLTGGSNVTAPSAMSSMTSRHPKHIHPSETQFSIPSSASFPSRPTSTNSTSSSLSSASFNNTNRSTNSIGNCISRPITNSSSSSSLASSTTTNPSVNKFNSHHGVVVNKLQQQPNNHHFSNQYNSNASNLLANPSYFKRPFDLPMTHSYDTTDTLSNMTASSTASSSSSGSSNFSAPPVIGGNHHHANNTINDIIYRNNLHARSQSECGNGKDSITGNLHDRKTKLVLQSSVPNEMFKLTSTTNKTATSNDTHSATNFPPTRPPRGTNQNLINTRNTSHNPTSVLRNNSISSTANEITNGSQFQKYVNVSNSRPPQNFNLEGVGDFQPYYEETKPFQMSDFYKYSAKLNNPKNIVTNNFITDNKFKTTRQLQEDVSKKNSLKFASCDEQIQASMKLIEKSGQKLIEATAKAIAVNPSLAEKLNNILPNNNLDRY